jgi:hypothetical protein
MMMMMMERMISCVLIASFIFSLLLVFQFESVKADAQSIGTITIETESENATLKITPNPYTLNNSIIIQDNNETMDFNHTNGSILLKNVTFASYVIQQVWSYNTSEIMATEMVDVNQTNPNPVVKLEIYAGSGVEEGDTSINPDEDRRHVLV